MEQIFEWYKKWREKTENSQVDEEVKWNEAELADKKAFMKYAGLKRLDNDDFEELEMQYDEYLIELETE